MKIVEIESLIVSFGFIRTDILLTLPIVVHGVPGCGKSTLIKSLIKHRTVSARTLGAPYGCNLLTNGVTTHLVSSPQLSNEVTILDEYQLGDASVSAGFTLLFGDPFQGTFRKAPHYIKELSHRVPRPIADFLVTRGYQIRGEREGSLTTKNPYNSQQGNPTAGTLLHLGRISQSLTHSHGLCSKHPTEVAGLEFDTVTVVYHSSEIADREAFFVACTRPTSTLVLISDEFNELRTTT
nr:MAG: putative helicase [Yunnan alphaflexivirus]